MMATPRCFFTGGTPIPVVGVLDAPGGVCGLFGKQLKAHLGGAPTVSTAWMGDRDLVIGPKKAVVPDKGRFLYVEELYGAIHEDELEVRVQRRGLFSSGE